MCLATPVWFHNSFVFARWSCKPCIKPPNLEDQGIPFCLDPYLWPVQHVRPASSCYYQHIIKGHLAIQAPPLHQSRGGYIWWDIQCISLLIFVHCFLQAVFLAEYIHCEVFEKLVVIHSVKMFPTLSEPKFCYCVHKSLSWNPVLNHLRCSITSGMK